MQLRTSASLPTNVDELVEFQFPLQFPLGLTTPGLVLLKHQVRKSKFDSLLDEVELIEANPKYAHIIFPDGKEVQ